MLEEFVKLVMNFLLNFINLAKEKLNPFLWIRKSPQNSPPVPLPTLEVISENTTTSAGQSQGANYNYNVDSDMMWMQWSLIGVCVAAIAAAVQAVQTPWLLHHKSYHWICMALVFSLTAAMVSIYIPQIYKRASLLVVHVGIFFVFTALVVALAINLQPSFKVISIAVYSMGVLIVIFTNLFKPTPTPSSTLLQLPHE